MDLGAEEFLKELALKLAGDVLQKSQLQDILKNAISSLPLQSCKLQKHLEQSFHMCLKKFSSYLDEIDQSSADTDFRKSLQLMIFMGNKSNSEMQEAIERAFEICDDLKSRIVFGKKLCNLVIVNKSLRFIHCIANSLYNVFEKEVEKVLEGGEDISLHLLKVTLINFFTLLQTSHTTSEKETEANLVPAFGDIMAAIVSLIIDVTIIESQYITDEKECLKKGNKLIETSLTLLGKYHSKLLESMIQTSTRHLPNADLILMPLYQHTLLRQKWVNESINEDRYMQCMMATLQGISLLQPRRSSVSHKLRLAALQTPARKGFFQWACARKNGIEVLCDTPLLESTSPMGVTKFFMNECDMDTMERFLDLCHAGLVDAEDDLDLSETKESIKEKPSELLFVLDTKRETSDVVQNELDQLGDLHGSDDQSDEDSDDELLRQTNYLLDETSKDDDQDGVSDTENPLCIGSSDAIRSKSGSKNMKNSKKAIGKKRKMLLLNSTLEANASEPQSVKNTENLKSEAKHDREKVDSKSTEHGQVPKKKPSTFVSEYTISDDGTVKRINKNQKEETRIPKIDKVSKLAEKKCMGITKTLLVKGKDILNQEKEKMQNENRDQEKGSKLKAAVCSSVKLSGKKLKKRKLKSETEERIDLPTESRKPSLLSESLKSWNEEANSAAAEPMVDTSPTPRSKATLAETPVSKKKKELNRSLENTERSRKLAKLASPNNTQNEISRTDLDDNHTNDLETSLLKNSKKKALKRKKLLAAKLKAALEECTDIHQENSSLNNEEMVSEITTVQKTSMSVQKYDAESSVLEEKEILEAPDTPNIKLNLDNYEHGVAVDETVAEKDEKLIAQGSENTSVKAINVSDLEKISVYSTMAPAVDVEKTDVTAAFDEVPPVVSPLKTRRSTKVAVKSPKSKTKISNARKSGPLKKREDMLSIHEKQDISTNDTEKLETSKVTEIPTPVNDELSPLKDIKDAKSSPMKLKKRKLKSETEKRIDLPTESKKTSLLSESLKSWNEEANSAAAEPMVDTSPTPLSKATLAETPVSKKKKELNRSLENTERSRKLAKLASPNNTQNEISRAYLDDNHTNDLETSLLKNSKKKALKRKKLLAAKLKAALEECTDIQQENSSFNNEEMVSEITTLQKTSMSVQKYDAESSVLEENEILETPDTPNIKLNVDNYEHGVAVDETVAEKDEKLIAQGSENTSVKAMNVSDLENISVYSTMAPAVDVEKTDVTAAFGEVPQVVSPLKTRRSTKVAVKSPKSKTKISNARKSGPLKKREDMLPIHEKQDIATNDAEKLETSKVIEIPTFVNDELSPLKDIKDAKSSPMKLKKRKSTGNTKQNTATSPNKSKKRRSAPELTQSSQNTGDIKKNSDHVLSETTENSGESVENMKKNIQSSSPITSPKIKKTESLDELDGGAPARAIIRDKKAVNRSPKKSPKHGASPSIKITKTPLSLKETSESELEMNQRVVSTDSSLNDVKISRYLTTEEEKELIEKLPDIIRSTETSTVQESIATDKDLSDYEPLAASKDNAISTTGTTKTPEVLISSVKNPAVVLLTKTETTVRLKDSEDKENQELSNKSIKVALEDIMELPQEKSETTSPFRNVQVVKNDTRLLSSQSISLASDTNDDFSEKDSCEDMFEPSRRSKRRKSIREDTKAKTDASDLLSPIAEEKVTCPRRSKRVSRTPAPAKCRTRTDSESSTASNSAMAVRRSSRLSQRKERTESESSTGSHSYSTRSRKV